MQRYDSYKDSGIQWLGQIPGHWEVSKVRTHFTQRTDKVSEIDFPPLSVSKQGIVPQLDDVAISQAEGNTRKLVRKGDFVVNSRSDRKGSCGVSPLDGSVSLINIVLEPHDIANQYIHYLFRMNDWIEDFYRHGRGIVADLWTTNYQQMKNMLMPIPPLAEQKAIVTYLDRETEKIDSFISSKEKEIRLLEELKQAEIANAVTKGLHPDVTLKDSGITWLGQVPEHWEGCRLCYKIASTASGAWGVDSKNDGLDIVCVRVADFDYSKGLIKEDKLTLRNYEGKLPTDKLLKNGDLLLEKSGGGDVYPVGRVVRYSLKSTIATCSNFIQKLSIKDNTDSDFLYYLFKLVYSKKVNGLFYNQTTGIQNLKVTEYLRQILFFPPLPEQKEIVEYLDRKCANIDKMISNIEQEITQLKEYKQRLIADAVTGQIKVC